MKVHENLIIVIKITISLLLITLQASYKVQGVVSSICCTYSKHLVDSIYYDQMVEVMFVMSMGVVL